MLIHDEISRTIINSKKFARHGLPEFWKTVDNILRISLKNIHKNYLNKLIY